VIYTGFDLETGSADKLYSHPRDGSYLRLMGTIINGQPALTTNRFELTEALGSADVIFGHNIFRFDLPALAVHAKADYAALAAKAVDTILLARLYDPPSARGLTKPGYYGLDALAVRLGHPGKAGDLKALAKEFGGFDQIPTDEPRYREYLTADLQATQAVMRELWSTINDYARREMRIAAIQGLMSVSGWRMDTELLSRRIASDAVLRANAYKALDRDFNLKVSGKAPFSSRQGQALLIEAFERLGVALNHFPHTATHRMNTSTAAMGDGLVIVTEDGNKVTYQAILRRYGADPAIHKLCHLVQVIGGLSSKYGEIDKYLVDGRLHGGIGEDQASGRWAMTKPSLTNVGKRGDKLRVRQVFLPEPGHVLLSADLDQVDMRALAALSQDPAYKALFDPGQDVHAEIAQLVLGDRSRREEAKPIGHGWNYGRSARTISESTAIPLEVVLRFDAAMRERFPRLCRWRDEVRERAQLGAFLDNGFGRKMRCDPYRAYTQAPALMGQGGARDLMCHALLRLHPSVHPMLRAVVHDEVVLSVPAEYADDVAAHVKSAFTFEWGGVPITAGVSRPSPNWAACYRKEE
jgi:DNA polymerase-1